MVSINNYSIKEIERVEEDKKKIFNEKVNKLLSASWTLETLEIKVFNKKEVKYVALMVKLD